MPQSLTTDLNDADSEHSETLQVHVTGNQSAISIFPDGFGDFGSAPGHGCPVFLELSRGRLRLIVFPDINSQDPTIIDLETAREDQHILCEEGTPASWITRQPDHNCTRGEPMAVTLNRGQSNEITLRVMLQSDDYGREYFDHHDTVDELLDSIRNVIKLAAEDGCERMIGIAVVPVGEYGSENGNGFGLKTDTGNFA